MATGPFIRNEALRAARRDAGLSQDGLVARLRSNGVPSANKKQVQRWESGEVTWPQGPNREALRRVFDRSPAELGFIDPEDPMHTRREVLTAAAGLAAAAVLPAASYARLEYALTHRPSVVTAEDAEQLLRASGVLYDREAHETAASLAPDLSRHLDLIAALLSVGTLPESVRRTLVLAGGTAACLGGWISHDQGATGDAAGYWNAAINAAKAANDGPLLSCVLTYQSYVHGARGDHRTAWTLLAQAGTHVRARGHAQARAWVSARQAEEAAALGEHATSLASLAEAMTAYDYVTTAESADRPWVRFFDAARLGSMGVAAYGAMNHPQLLPAADAVMASLGEDRQKTRAVILGDVATARVSSGDLDAGCELARQALTATVAGEAMLGYQRLRALRPRLDGHQDVAAVRQLLPELDAAGITRTA
jgi:transcriptional regulator with XRE-family HTH domain